MSLLLFSLNCRPDTPDGAEFLKLVAQIEQRFPTEFFLPVTTLPPLATRPHASWDWVTLPSPAKAQVQMKMLRAYGRWLRPVASVFWGQASDSWVSQCGAEFGLRVLHAGAFEQAAASSAQLTVSGASATSDLLGLLDAHLPLTVILTPGMKEVDILATLQTRPNAPEVRVHCPGALGHEIREQLKLIEQQHSGIVHLMLPLKQGLIRSASRSADLAFLYRNRKRFKVTVCAQLGSVTAPVLNRAWRALGALS